MKFTVNRKQLADELALLAQLPLPGTALVALTAVPLDVANRLLVDWGHRLGAIHRPFRMEAYGLEVHSRLISVAVSASVVSKTVAGFRRNEVVECARLCSEPRNAWATRVMLRLWREVSAPLWPCWPVKAAISYSMNAHHTGNLYRMDGWRKVNENCGSSGGGSWSRKRYASDAVYGRKTLWVWEYAKPFSPARLLDGREEVRKSMRFEIPPIRRQRGRHGADAPDGQTVIVYRDDQVEDLSKCIEQGLWPFK